MQWITGTYLGVSLPVPGAGVFEQWLFDLAPYDAAKGEEGITLHGAVLLALLCLIAPLAWKGLTEVDVAFTRWTWGALGLIVATLLVAALRAILSRSRLERHEVQQWLWETWRFVKQIFPILVVGVLLVGAVRPFIRPEWVQAAAGTNSLPANLAGVAFGIFMYFPTLVEVPVARMFQSLGMHPGPLPPFAGTRR